MKRFFVNVKLTVTNCIRYLPLLGNLISRGLKRKYRRSILGYVWCVLNPLLVMLIMNFVFSHMFASSIANFPVYLFCGRMMFSFITDATGAMENSILSNGALMRKTRIPYYIFPMSAFCTSVVNFLFSLVAFALVLLFTGTPVSVHVAAFPLVLLEMFAFSFGLGLFLAQANVFIRDVNYLYAVFITGWMYLTPLFYPLTSLPEIMQYLITYFNPACYYVDQSRAIFLYHAWPDGALLLRGAIAAAVFLVLGLVSYGRAKNDLILYV